MKQWSRLTISLLCIVVLIIFIISWKLLTNSSKKTHEMPPTPVKVTLAKHQPMPIIIQTIGTIEAQKSVVITSQITGIIKNIAFRSGQSVRENQLLFEIEPASFMAALDQARAVLTRDQAQLALAEADAKRFASLVKQEYITKQQYDQAQAAVSIQKATVRATLAQVRQAQIQLDYTKIRTPVAGKTGNVTLRPGDLINANTTALVTINQLDPVWVNFNLPQKELLAIQKAHHERPLKIEVLTEDGKQLLGIGELDFIDNTINPQTGTVLLKGHLNNDKQLFWPGLMVTVKLILAIEPNAIVLPISALSRDNQGSFVYRVEQDKAIINRVTFRQIDDLAVITQGLEGGESIITVAPPGLSNGTKITVAASGDVT